jgi:hypothetical protein
MAKITDEERRLKKEYKAIRGTYTIRMPDDMPYEKAEKNLNKWFEYWGERLEDHNMFGMWRDRK